MKKNKKYYNELHPTCEKQLKGIDFIGGTFVEYDQRTNKEFCRGTISKFSCKKNAFNITTKESDECTELFKLGSPHLVSMESTILHCYEGVWLIDTGISRVYGGNPTALVIENGKFSPWEIIQ